MAGLPIHVFGRDKTWMAGIRPGMAVIGYVNLAFG
jgi:hypothetical protein